MAKKGKTGYYNIARCERCSEEHFPVTYYSRTKEYLCEPCLAIRKREVKAEKHRKQEEEEKEIWNELTSLPLET